MKNILQQGHLKLHGAPEGQDARHLIELCQLAWETSRAPVLHIVRDDERLHILQMLLSYFAPDLDVIALPAWDCLPYDRVSPNADILAQRTKAFARLANLQQQDRPLLILVTLHAIIQRLPPLSHFQNAHQLMIVGQTVDRTALLQFLESQGYIRVSTVREPGEFALRGSIADIFPAGFIQPVRIDFFDNEIESMRSFDPIDQTSQDKVESIQLTATQEIHLNPETISQFRSRYRELFGSVQSDDSLYEAISQGHRYPGIEHWLPLFYTETTTLLDHISDRTPIIFDHQIETAYHERMAQVVEFYNARLELFQQTDKKSSNMGHIYKPVPPPLMYLSESEWKKLHQYPITRELIPFPSQDEQSIDIGGKLAPNLSVHGQTNTSDIYQALSVLVKEAVQNKQKCIIACYSDGSKARIQSLCSEHGVIVSAIDFIVLPLEHGFVTHDTVLLTEQDLLGDRLTRSPKRRKRNESAIFNVTELSDGDYVVHVEHGIGKFVGLVTMTVDGAAHDCVCVVYAGNDKLFVPVENLDVLSRFGSDLATAQLDRLGGAGWQARKARIKKRLLEMAEGLIAIAAKRRMTEAPDINIPEGSYQEFCARFPYQETDDQERAIADVLGDLHHDHAMDRLVCGDVGFGKTEVAMRAAFVAAMAGLQVAVVVPTTLLARQHFANFVKRFKGFPIRIGQLSRMVSNADATRYRDLLASGQLDIVIGTHAILSEKVKFQNLGLLIVDEEQNFGVKQKEKLKELKDNVHVLTLTATPIPRTLQMAMSGIRDLSLMATPPVDRLAVRTSVMPFDPVIIREAIMREYYRGGQIFYVCPRLAEMDDVQTMLSELVPEIKVVQAHGQMSPTDLDERMTAFYEGHYHLLLATNIIESGLDIPNANTLIVHRSDLLGLSQLYQIRGRIGRSKVRGYAYFTYKDEKLLTETAKQRLHVISTLDTLGAGFQLASYDMDIRGAGNLLGEEQSGHIKEVGVELYQQMLEEALQSVRDGESSILEDKDWVPTINLGITVLIPDSYVQDLPVRLALYRRLAALSDQESIEAFGIELVDRFGAYPHEVKNLLDVMVIKHWCKQAGVERIDAGPKGALITFRHNQFTVVDGLLAYMQQQAGTLKLRPDHKLMLMRSWDDVGIRLKGVVQLMQDLVKLVQAYN
jgi:transcription-repair coupling factor (superfamily II helicase)